MSGILHIIYFLLINMRMCVCVFVWIWVFTQSNLCTLLWLRCVIIFWFKFRNLFFHPVFRGCSTVHSKSHFICCLPAGWWIHMCVVAIKTTHYYYQNNALHVANKDLFHVVVRRAIYEQFLMDSIILTLYSLLFNRFIN